MDTQQEQQFLVSAAGNILVRPIEHQQQDSAVSTSPISSSPGLSEPHTSSGFVSDKDEVINENDLKSCFTPISTTKLMEMLDTSEDSLNTCTMKTIKYGVGMLSKYATSIGRDIKDFDSFSTKEADEFLAKFYLTMRRNDGSLYSQKSMQGIKFGLQRYFHKTKGWDIIRDKEFGKSILVFKKLIKKLKMAGLGFVQQSVFITDSDFLKIITSQALNINTPLGLQNKVFVDVSMNLCIRGRHNFRCMVKEDFIMQVDDTGRRFITLKEPKGIRPVCEGIDIGEDRLTEEPGNIQCPVHNFLKYTSKLHPKFSPFWQTPIKLSSDSCMYESWYTGVAIGINNISSKMRQISIAAGCARIYSNRTLRATGLRRRRHMRNCSTHNCNQPLGQPAMGSELETPSSTNIQIKQEVLFELPHAIPTQQIQPGSYFNEFVSNINSMQHQHKVNKSMEDTDQITSDIELEEDDYNALFDGELGEDDDDEEEDDEIEIIEDNRQSNMPEEIKITEQVKSHRQLADIGQRSSVLPVATDAHHHYHHKNDIVIVDDHKRPNLPEEIKVIEKVKIHRELVDIRQGSSVPSAAIKDTRKDTSIGRNPQQENSDSDDEETVEERIERGIQSPFKRLEWMNTSESLDFVTNLKGKLVVLDFFTYCCINCMHILPDLEKIEEKFTIADGLVVIGAHSAKFENEKTSANILNAIIRYNITHPVVNDDTISLWNDLEIVCWPTIVIVSPTGTRLATYIGEGHLEELTEFCSVALKFYKSRGLISEHSLPIELARSSLPQNILSFPGKVSLSPDGNHLAISDTGHHRVLIVTIHGIVLHTIGGRQSGYKDGRFEEARMNCPQGVTWHEDYIFVADTENHRIRMIDMKNKVVSTVVGTGEMGQDKEGGKPGHEQPISSPWDVAVGGPNNGVLFIAMAGTHQIWTLFLKETIWLKKINYEQGICIRFAGSGNEENRNNSYPHKAGFAQPSGLTLTQDEKLNCLFLADSESSSIRSVALKDGATKGIVGGERDPMNLFAYGDVDGKGIDAKLQHPLGVAWNRVDGKIYVADSYNHKIKMVDPIAKTCTTLTGSGKPGKEDGSIFEEVEFNEPGGLCVTADGLGLFIADTNNHAIRFVDLTQKSVQKLKIIESQGKIEPNTTSSEDASNIKTILPKTGTDIIQLDSVNLIQNSKLTIQLDVRLPKDCKLTEGAPSVWQAYSEDLSGKQLESLFKQQKMKFEHVDQQPIKTWIVDSVDSFQGNINIEVKVYFCEASGTCHMRGILFKLPVTIMNENSMTDVNICLKNLVELN